MEASEPLGGAEEYSSNESGWTMYIDSSIHEHDASYVDDSDDDYQSPDTQIDHHHVKNRNDDDDDDGDDNDSMASDASSGPCHYLSEGNSKPAYSKYSSKKNTMANISRKQDKEEEQKKMENPCSKQSQELVLSKVEIK